MRLSFASSSRSIADVAEDFAFLSLPNSDTSLGSPQLPVLISTGSLVAVIPQTIQRVTLPQSMPMDFVVMLFSSRRVSLISVTTRPFVVSYGAVSYTHLRAH